MRWKAQHVLWLTPPTFLLCHHLPTPLCSFWVLWAIHALQMKNRPCCPSWWAQMWSWLADPDNLGHTLSCQVCLGLSPQRSAGRSLQPCSAVPWAVQVAHGVWTGVSSRAPFQTPVSMLFSSATCLNWATTAFTLSSYCSPGTALHATHEISVMLLFGLQSVFVFCLTKQKDQK